MSTVIPEPSNGSVVRIRGKKMNLVIPNLINVLNDDKRFAYWSSLVDQNRDMLVHMQDLEKQRVLVAQIFFSRFILYVLLC